MRAIRRAQIFAISTAVSLAACFAIGASAQTLPAEWTAFRLNPELNPVVDAPPRLALNWTFKTGAGISSSPTISGNTVFIASNDHHVYALDLLTGKPRWTFAADDAVMTAPIVYHNVVIVGEGNNRSDGSMFVPPHYLLMGDGTNALIGIDAVTGKEVWRRHLSGTGMPTGAIVDGAYVHHDAAGMLYAFGAADGSFRWRTYVGSTAAMVAANRFAGTTIVTGGDYPNAMYGIDGTNGKTLWEAHFSEGSGGFDDCPPASDGTSIFAMYNARPDDSKFTFVGYNTPAIQHVYSLDGQTGAIRWDVALDHGILPQNNSTSIPMLYNGAMYVGSSIVSAMYAIDMTSGKTLWRRDVNGSVKSGSVAKDGIVYFGDGKGTIWALDARDGSVRGSKQFPENFNVGSPIIVGSNLIIGTEQGSVLAMPLKSITSATPKPTPAATATGS